MTAPVPDQTPEEVVRLRADPPKVMRLSRKAVAIASASALGLVASALIYALWPQTKQSAQELYTTDQKTAADGLASAPKDYSQVPKLGPALPGDLGKPILDARRRGDVATPAVAGAPQQTESPAQAELRANRQRAQQEREAARSSQLFIGTGNASPPAVGAMSDSREASPAQTDATPASSDSKQAFLDKATDQSTVTTHRVTPALSAHMLQAGTVIPAALITGIRSDLPGQITGQVTQNVYDSVTGRTLLIAQGARLIGEYDAGVTFGQNRALLVWTRLIFPDGRSITLDRLPGADTQGFAGLQDRTDYHWGGVVKATLVSTLLGIGTELGASGDGDLERALRQGSQDSINRAGEQVVSRELNVRPTLTIRPGYPVRVMVTRDLVLEPLEQGR
jgi:type IV secretion system protein VirB10